MTNVLFWSGNRPSRGVAFAIHLALSLLAFLSLVLMMVLFWFPGKLFMVDGGWEGLKLVAMVDLVLGPALTLILYKPEKPKLIFDLSIIAAIQLSALAYGFYTTHAQRTVAIVYAEHTFTTVSARDHREASRELASLDKTPGEVPEAGFLKVPMLLTPQPENYGDFLTDILNGFPEPRERSDLYIPISDGRTEMEHGRWSEEQLVANGTLQTINDALTRRSRVLSDVEVYSFKTRYSSGMALYDPQTHSIVDFVPFSFNQPNNQSVAIADK